MFYSYNYYKNKFNLYINNDWSKKLNIYIYKDRMYVIEYIFLN